MLTSYDILLCFMFTISSHDCIGEKQEQIYAWKKWGARG